MQIGKITAQSTLTGKNTPPTKTLHFETQDKQHLFFVTDKENIYRPRIAEEKTHKFLLFIYSWKRPLFLSGQVFRLFNQTYQNFDINISIKGVPQENMMQNTIFKEWQPFIQSNRLHVKFDTNKDQLSNILDALSGIDLDKYDYFCKIDDDDWYAPNYLEEVNKQLNVGYPISGSLNDMHYHLINTPTHAAFTIGKGDSVVGATLCFNKKIADFLFSLQKQTLAEQAQTLGISIPLTEHYKKRGEDILITNYIKENAILQVRETPIPLFMRGGQYPSIPVRKKKNKELLKKV